jgi:cell division transport system permease protein
MLGWLFVSPPERRLLGASSRRAPTPWVIAIMTFTIMLIAATGLALANTASVLSSAIEARFALEVPGGGAKLDQLLSMVRSSPGVTAVEAVSEQDMRRTLERWLGSAAASRDLPVPALINFDVRAGTDIKPIEARARAIEPASRIVSHRDTVGPLLRSLTLLQVVALGLVLLLSAAAAAAVVLAARGALDTHRFTIEVMHGIGATDLQLTHIFQRKIALDALLGSVAGALAGALVLILLASGASFVGELTGGASLSGVDFLLLLLLPFALTALAAWVARMAVLAALRENL